MPSRCSATTSACIWTAGPPRVRGLRRSWISLRRHRGYYVTGESSWKRCTHTTTPSSPMREYLVVFGVCLGVTYLVASLTRLAAMRFQAVAPVRDRDVHAVPKPYFGGPAMWAGLAAAYVTATYLPFLSRADATVFDDMKNVLIGGAVICAVGVIDDLFELDALSKLAGQVFAAVIAVALGVQFVYLPICGHYIGLDQASATIPSVLLIGGAVICAVGVIDDLFELDALSKLAGQVFAAVIAVALGVQFVYLPIFGNYIGLDQAQAMILSVVLIVATANAVNFIDGLDGLAAGMVAIAAVAFFSYAFGLAVVNGEPRAIAAALLTISLA